MNKTCLFLAVGTATLMFAATAPAVAAMDSQWETTVVTSANPSVGEVTVVGRPAQSGATAPVRVLSDAARAAKLAVPTADLLLGYYTIDGTNPSGVTTLFAVRNILNQTVTLRVDYFPTTGGSVVQTMPIQPRQTVTRNLRDVLNLPVTQGGFKQGWAIISARDLGTGAPLSEPYFHGDTFIVNPGQDFAVGSVLEDQMALCENWDTRYAVGGAFDDTEMRLTLPFNAPGSTNQVATIRVYDEAGTFFGEGNLTMTGPVGRLFASDILAQIGGGPSNGVIEWTFLGGMGSVTQEIQADGRYAAGWTPACLDSAF